MAGSICASVATVALLIVFWEWLSGGESGSTTIRNIALVVAGLIALPLAIWRAVVAERQANTAQQGLLNERYQNGAEMLGSAVLSVRLGGIYALQRLAEECPEQYHLQIMRLFCAFVRLPTKDQSLESGKMEIEPGTLLGIRQDVEVVMEVIGSRAKPRIDLEREAGFRLDLRGAKLPKAQFLDADLSGAMFHHSNLSGANFANTDVSDTLLTYADLSEATFRNMNFTGTRLGHSNLSSTLLQDANLPKVDFHGAILSGANLIRANLSGSSFQDAILANAWLEDAKLSGVLFLRADLSGAYLMQADLSHAQLLDVDLNKANFSDANLSGAKFSIGGPQTARGLTRAQLDEALADPNNPPDLTGVLDAESGKPLVWRGKLPNDEA